MYRWKTATCHSDPSCTECTVALFAPYTFKPLCHKALSALVRFVRCFDTHYIYGEYFFTNHSSVYARVSVKSIRTFRTFRTRHISKRYKSTLAEMYGKRNTPYKFGTHRTRNDHFEVI